MTRNDLITKQQLEIETLKRQVKEYKENCGTIQDIIYCIGGPLNDNKLGFSHKQQMTFFQIMEHVNIPTEDFEYENT